MLPFPSPRTRAAILGAAAVCVLGPAPALPVFAQEDAKTAARAIDSYLSAPDLRYDGAVAVVVQGGRIVFAKGYGFEDGVKRTVPVDPAATRFEIGSITKTFTGTRIAQLIEEGRIGSIDDPANKYLKGWQLPDNQGQPITLRHLLTHQAGFADAELHDYAPGDHVPAADAAYFRSRLPRFIGPAGKRSNYSNYGYGVLGRIVADVTGQPSNDALAERIWKPAGMSSTESKVRTGDYPRHVHSTAYYADGSRSELSAAVVADPIISSGAGGALSTGEDMARYMIGLLGGSAELHVPALASNSTRALMFSSLGRNDALSQSYGTAFMIGHWNGSLIVEHGGRVLGGHSVMVLLPERDLGYFISLSGESGAPSASDLLLQFVGKGRTVPARGVEPFRVPNMFTLRAPPLVAVLGWPKPPTTDELPPVHTVELSVYRGSFESERRTPGTRQKWVDWFIKGAVVDVRPDGKGGLRIGPAEGYRQIAEDVFWRQPPENPRSLLGWRELAIFERNRAGAVQRIWFGYTDATYDKLIESRTPAAVLGWLQPGAAAMLLGIGAFLWRRGTPGRWLALVMPLLIVLLPLTFFGFLPSAQPSPFGILHAQRHHFAAFVLVGDAIVLAALWMAWSLVRQPPPGMSGLRRAVQMVHGVVVVAGAASAAWALTLLNATGWPF